MQSGADSARAVGDENEAAGWNAALRLRFAADQQGRGTRLVEREHTGPLLVQRPFYPEGAGVCHVILLHPPGGLVPGDRLQLEAQVEAGAHGLITAPAAAKLYRSAGAETRIDQQLFVAADGALEWLPQESIAFAGVRARCRTRVRLDGESARFLGWEIVCLGRRAGEQPFARGDLRQSFEIYRGDRPLLIERNRFRGGDAFLCAAYGLRGHTIAGTLAAYFPGSRQLVARVRAELEADDDFRSAFALEPCLFSLTAPGELIVARYLGDRSDQALALFQAARRLLRPLVIAGAPADATAPRIWAT